MNSKLPTLKKLRKAAQRYVADLELDMTTLSGEPSLSEREKGVRILRNLLKIIEEIAELEERFSKASAENNTKEVDSKQRLELARRIQALRTRN